MKQMDMHIKIDAYMDERDHIVAPCNCIGNGTALRGDVLLFGPRSAFPVDRSFGMTTEGEGGPGKGHLW
jgi:hypothetical protein